jgi:transposase
MPKGVPNKRYTAEFKVEVVETMKREGLSYREAARQFEIRDKNRVAAWERIYLREGSEGLGVERRGRASAASGVQKGHPAKLPKQVEEDLIAENQRLRAENAYLKNLQALVLEDERQARKKRW